MGAESIANQFDAIRNEVLNCFNENHALELHHSAIVLLFDGMIEKYKSINLLLENKQFEGIEIIERSILESSVYLDYILSGTHKLAKNRGRAFFLSYKLQESLKVQDVIDRKPFGIDADDMLSTINERLSSDANPNYSSLAEYIVFFREEYKKCFNFGNRSGRDKRQQIRNWFNQDGTRKNIYDLFCFINREDEYKAFYSYKSMDVHTTSVISNGIVDDGLFTISYSINPNEVNVNCIFWIFNVAKKMISYFGIKNNPNIKLQLTIIRNNWVNQRFKMYGK